MKNSVVDKGNDNLPQHVARTGDLVTVIMNMMLGLVTVYPQNIARTGDLVTVYPQHFARTGDLVTVIINTLLVLVTVLLNTLLGLVMW